MREVFQRYELEQYWSGAVPIPEYAQWTVLCREATLKQSNAHFAGEVQRLSTLRPLYAHLKAYPWVDPSLFDGTNSQGRWLKLKARSGTLPLNRRAADLTRSRYTRDCAKRKTPLDATAMQAIEHTATCGACASGEVEDAQHFFFRCNASAYHRLECTVVQRLRALSADYTVHCFQRMSEFDRLRVLLGGTLDAPLDARCGADPILTRELRTPTVAAAIDRTVKNFLLTRWRDRTQRVGGEASTVASGNGFAVVTQRTLNTQPHFGAG